MRILKELAITDLSYRLAEKLDNFTVVHYVIKNWFAMNQTWNAHMLNAKEELIKKLTEKLGEPIEIEATEKYSTLMQMEEVTHLASPGVITLLNRRYPTSYAEYNEERPTALGFKAKTQRWLKKVVVKYGWKYVHRRVNGYVRSLFSMRYNLPVNFFYYKFNQWNEEIYTRKMSPITCLSLSCTEAHLAHTIKTISDVIEFQLGEQIMGSMVGIQKVLLADVVGDGKKRYVIWCGLLLKSMTTELLTELGQMAKTEPKARAVLDRYLVVEDGAIGQSISKSSMDEPTIITEFVEL